MLKRILAVMLAALMVMSFAAGCQKRPEKGSSSKKPTSSNVENNSSEDDNNVSSSTMAEVESKDDSSYHPYEWELKTKSAFFRDTDEAKQSVTESSGIKNYKAKNTAYLMAYGANPGYCDYYGKDDASRLRQFKEVVEEGYFNAYFISTGTYLVDAVKIVAENGGAVFLSTSRFIDGDGMDIEQWCANFDIHVNRLKEADLWGAVVGYYWDEPIWQGQPNESFLMQSEALYKRYGLRTFPVFATGVFSGMEGNELDLGQGADENKKLAPAAAKYLTDISFDAYGVDVRDGTSYSASTIERWKKNISPNATNAKAYYTEYKKKLQAHVGHDANYWYWPCAYAAPLGAGALKGITRADEDYWIAHLDFMAEDVLKEKHIGGIAVYGYGINNGFVHHDPMKDKDGNYRVYPETVKYEKYAACLKKWREKFDSVTPTLVDLGL